MGIGHTLSKIYPYEWYPLYGNVEFSLQVILQTKYNGDNIRTECTRFLIRNASHWQKKKEDACDLELEWSYPLACHAFCAQPRVETCHFWKLIKYYKIITCRIKLELKHLQRNIYIKHKLDILEMCNSFSIHPRVDTCPLKQIIKYIWVQIRVQRFTTTYIYNTN